MNKDQIYLELVLPVEPKRVYDAWLNSKEHGEFTGGGEAKISPVTGSKYSAWDGYISGEILELQPGKRILQTWRSTDFPEDQPDSIVDVILEPVKEGSKLILKHFELPDDQVEGYTNGWQEYYFQPMKEYFKK